MNSPSKVILKDILEKSEHSPASRTEVRIAHSLVKRLLNQGEGPSSVIKVVVRYAINSHSYKIKLKNKIKTFKKIFLMQQIIIIQATYNIMQIPAGHVDSFTACQKTV